MNRRFLEMAAFAFGKGGLKTPRVCILVGMYPLGERRISNVIVVTLNKYRLEVFRMIFIYSFYLLWS